MDLVRDCYEAYVLYMFFNLLKEFINTNEEEEEAEEKLREEVQRQRATGETIREKMELGYGDNDDVEDAFIPPSLSEEAHKNESINEPNISEHERIVRILAAKPRMRHPV